jgi:molybdopterin/thiamine biosynthesis adenylyltransferase
MPPSRAFEAAWLVLPKSFPDSCATIRLSEDAVLRIPHIEIDGKLCFSGDRGPACNYSPEDRLEEMLYLFNEEFFVPWLSGELDHDFEDECRTYWEIWVAQHKSKLDAIWRVYTVDERPSQPRLASARLLLPDRTLVIDDDLGIASRLVASISQRSMRTMRGPQIMRAYVADLAIDSPWTPLIWPKSVAEIDTILRMRLNDRQYREFSRIKGHHRIALFRSPNCNHAYLLPNGPPTVIHRGKSKFAVPTRALLPLSVERADPAWTYGRDQIQQIGSRQAKHVVVLGAGALASPVIDQLARAGVGRITVVDPQDFASPNIGRHYLGAESLHQSKSFGVALRVAQANPACKIAPSDWYAEPWLFRHGLRGVDAILDLTGEPDVRLVLEKTRQHYPVPLLVAWMEPFVAAAHVVCLPPNMPWLRRGVDPLLDIQAVDWPENVIQREPGCSSTFQSYTPAQAGYAVSLTTEAALTILDGEIEQPTIQSWVRGQRYLDRQYAGLTLRPWANGAAAFDGVLLERKWDE